MPLHLARMFNRSNELATPRPTCCWQPHVQKTADQFKFIMNYRKVFDPVRFRRRRYEAICSLIKLKDTDSVLDVGCGSGLSFGEFNRENNIVGLDLFRSYSAPNFRFVKGSAENMPFDNREFDVVVSIGCLEHIRPIDRLDKSISEIDRVSHRGVVVVPSIATPLDPHFQKFLWQLRPFDKRERLSNKTLGFQEAGKHEKLNYMSDDTWLNFSGFQNWRVKNYWHIYPLLRNLFIYKS